MKRLAVLAAAIVLIAAPAQATPFIVVLVEGTITSVDASNGLLPPEFASIAVGQPFSVTYEFQDVFPDSNPLPTRADYNEVLWSMSVTAGG